MQRRALALFSGGLDSILAVKVIQQQGIDVLALNFTSPFFSSSQISETEPEAARYARRYNIPFRSIQLGQDFLDTLRNPRYGYGSALNPCIDCKTSMIQQAGKIMHELQADFVITGEVVGQRPMSQRHDTMRLIERNCGIEGLLLRPLSARYLKVTIPESEGWVNRDILPALRGRGRKEQMRLAKSFGIDLYPAPGGGCLLTETSFIPKIKDLLDHYANPSSNDFELLKTGRHFRLSPYCKAIVGKNSQDNQRILRAAGQDVSLMHWRNGAGPTVLLLGKTDNETIRKAGRILLRYTRLPKGQETSIQVQMEGNFFEVIVLNDIDELELESLRI